MSDLLAFEDLTFYYPGAAQPALADIGLKFSRGEFIGITGPAGAGKSTLAFCCNGVIPHYQAGKIRGRVVLEGRPLKDMRTPEIAVKIGSVMQDPEAQIVSLSVEEEIAFGLENFNFPRSEMEVRIQEAMAAVGITEMRQRPLTSLSGGQKQRVVLAAVLALRPEVLVLDEPTSELDPLGTEDIFKTLSRLNAEQGITVILCEQKVDQLIRYLTRLVVLDQGRIVADGKPARVLARKEVFDLGIKIPQVSEFALLWAAESGRKLSEVPVTVEEGLTFVREQLRY